VKNPQLKRAHSEDEYTPQMIQELVKCKKDPVYFIRKYIKVQHPTKGTIPFDMFEYQERFVRCMESNRFVITLQPRQCAGQSRRLDRVGAGGGHLMDLLRGHDE